MIPSLRKAFNQSFTEKKYQQFLQDLDSRYPGAIEFRVAETPIFIDKAFQAKMLEACEHIIDLITDEKYAALTDAAIPADDRVAGEAGPPQMIAFDFGICYNDQKELVPQLIEMQGFPTLFGFQVYLSDTMRRHFSIPDNFHPYLGQYTRESYLAELRELIVGQHDPQEVILLEIEPHKQKTRIDFYCTRDYIGIEPVCLTELIREGRQLFYIHPGTGQKTRIKRIYNRVIFDELNARRFKPGEILDIRESFDVEWVPHPNWFYRISKYSIPFLRHPYIPATYFLHEVKQVPADLENYVLKPLFSFAGQGVIIDVERKHIEAISDPENWILQRKVDYAGIIETPDVPAKAEIRIMYIWNKAWSRPRPAINLARLSKGKMIGVNYNKDKSWVGGSVCMMEH